MPHLHSPFLLHQLAATCMFLDLTFVTFALLSYSVCEFPYYCNVDAICTYHMIQAKMAWNHVKIISGCSYDSRLLVWKKQSPSLVWVFICTEIKIHLNWFQIPVQQVTAHSREHRQSLDPTEEIPANCPWLISASNSLQKGWSLSSIIWVLMRRAHCVPLCASEVYDHTCKFKGLALHII